jgi:probable addiction module antidote protein
MKKPLSPGVSYHEWLIGSLKDEKEAFEYLKAALEDSDPKMFLVALRNVIEAHGIKMTEFAGKANLNRENLYKILSEKGNPNWKSIHKILDVMGYSLTLGVKTSARPKRTRRTHRQAVSA